MIKVACEPRTRIELTASPTFTSRERTRPSIGLTIVELRKSSCAFSSEALACATWAADLAISALETARLRCALSGLQLNLVEFREQLALLHAITVVHIKFLDDAAGFGLDLHFRQRLNLSGSHDHARQVATLHGSEL